MKRLTMKSSLRQLLVLSTIIVLGCKTGRNPMNAQREQSAISVSSGHTRVMGISHWIACRKDTDHRRTLDTV